MSNPVAAIDALATPHVLTLGQAALLEKIASPLLVGGEEACAADLIPSLYLLTLPSAEGAQHLCTLTAEAFQWADTLTPEVYRAKVQEAMAAVRTFYEMLPSPEGEPKKVSPATDGSPHWSSGAPAPMAGDSQRFSTACQQCKSDCSSDSGVQPLPEVRP